MYNFLKINVLQFNLPKLKIIVVKKFNYIRAPF
jgi:hypothetical protein